MKQGMKQSVKRGMECDHRCSLVGHEVEQAEGCLPTARPMAAVQRRVEAPEPPHTARTPCTDTMHRHAHHTRTTSIYFTKLDFFDHSFRLTSPLVLWNAPACFCSSLRCGVRVGSPHLRFAVHVQACGDSICYSPEVGRETCPLHGV